MRIPLRIFLLSAFVLITFIPPLEGQSVLERSPNLSGGWVGQPGMLIVDLPHRFSDAGGEELDITGSPTFSWMLGLPQHSLAGARFAPESAVVPGESDEWEIFGRYQLMSQAQDGWGDLGVQVGYNGAAESLDGEMSLAGWLGPVRLLGSVRGMSGPYGGDDTRFAVAGGAVFHPLPGRLPIALAGDVGALLNREEREETAWSAGIQIGASFTPYTLSLLATNTSTSTLEGVSRGGGSTRYGFELTLPIPAGRFLGWYLPREEAADAVIEEPGQAARIVQAGIRRYFFTPKVIEVPAGTTIEWTNYDEVIHTVSADDGTWDSGAIRQGETWRATFNEPGRYPFHCGPHPFMKGMVVVR